jgi:leucyl-tRNA synthetase
MNPYYDKFIRWQFCKLKQNNYVDFGNRPTIYSISQGQACADHARDEGEGVNPQEYTLIKIKVNDVSDLKSRIGYSGTKDVYLVAATLRPETMYGQTNCFVLPDGDYGCYQMKNDEVFICSNRSAINMAYQDMTNKRGVVEQLGELFKGVSLIGLALNAPNATYPIVYTLPLLSISMGKGTGVVTSVPSDAPDDYIALRDLQRNEKGIRDEFPMITDEMVNFDVVSIISIPGGDEDLKIEEWGDCAAVTGCEVLKVKNQHDKKKLIKIKKAVYNKGFYQGVMKVGSAKGQLVQDAKAAVRKEMIQNGQACVYWEPEGLVVSRSGDECIVAFLDQWYLKYGEETWRDNVINHVENANAFDAYADSSLKQYVNTLNWLGNWACSRNFGLGTRLPWDEQFVIESLSDSTIYMAYYTIAHMLQGENNMDGQKTGPSGITSDELNDACFEYIFCNGPLPENASEAVKEQLPKLQHEFMYWYPMDLRVSGKDLIRNHLTMALYNHAAIWKDQPHMWPKSYFTNGHVMVDGSKMSKSKGNFISLSDATTTNNVHHRRKANGDLEWKAQSWSADTVRLALADGGDTNDDANFESETANVSIHKMYTHIHVLHR